MWLLRPEAYLTQTQTLTQTQGAQPHTLQPQYKTSQRQTQMPRDITKDIPIQENPEAQDKDRELDP